MHAATIIADLATVLDYVVGDAIQERKYLSRRRSQGVNFAVIHAGKIRTRQQDPRLPRQ